MCVGLSVCQKYILINFNFLLLPMQQPLSRSCSVSPLQETHQLVGASRRSFMAVPIIFVTFADFYGTLSLTATGSNGKNSVLGGPALAHLCLAPTHTHTRTHIQADTGHFRLNDPRSHLINNELRQRAAIELQSSA